MKLCDQPVRGGGNCQLDPGHRGHHSTVVYRCDGCCKARRGQPHRWSRDGEYEKGLAFCFLCVLEDELEAAAHGDYWDWRP